jgi:23S rRNA maturation-related 3'-5' exoribonuclease YhaM
MVLKDKFMEYFNMINREGKDRLLKHLENNGYFTSPSSTQFHGACDGGNLEHSLNVTETALKIYLALEGEDSEGEIPLDPKIEESIIICGLFHDLGKANYYSKPQYVENVLKGGERSKSKPFESNKDRLALPHEITSLHILSKFIPLTEDEVFAIVFHNGLYTGLGYAVKGNETKLYQILHFADMWASRFLEVANSSELKETIMF